MALHDGVMHALNAELQALREIRETIHIKIDRRIKALETLLEPFEIESLPPERTASQSVLLSSDKPQLAGVGFRQSILTVLGDVGAPLKAAQISRELNARGFSGTNGSVNLNNRISGELGRLAKLGKVKKVDRGRYRIA